MTRLYLAEFADQRRFVAAAGRVRSSRCRVVDAFTPYPVEELSDRLDHPSSRIRPAMLVGGLVMAAFAYGLEYYSAVVNYPYNSGGRPLDAWPAFMLVPFATGIFVAAVSGFTAFLAEARLPALSNPLFAVEGFERASQDRFILAIESMREAEDQTTPVDLLLGLGAISVREINA
jgi:hypothetical protein